ncbi:unnamed protein product, partial [Heterobilharzia americana]
TTATDAGVGLFSVYLVNDWPNTPWIITVSIVVASFLSGLKTKYDLTHFWFILLLYTCVAIILVFIIWIILVDLKMKN